MKQTVKPSASQPGTGIDDHLPARDVSFTDRLVTGFALVGPLPPLLLVMVIVFAVGNPVFLSGDNLLNVATQSVVLLLITVGQTLVLITGGFDISVGANVALTSIVSSTVMVAVYGGYPQFEGQALFLGLIAALVVGCLVGLINGIGVAVLQVNPFIVTLATASVFGGVTLLVSGGSEVSGLPPTFTHGLGSGSWLGIPMPVLVSVPLVALVWAVLRWTRFGRHLYAIGSNAISARVAGIRRGRRRPGCGVHHGAHQRHEPSSPELESAGDRRGCGARARGGRRSVPQPRPHEGCTSGGRQWLTP